MYNFLKNTILFTLLVVLLYPLAIYLRGKIYPTQLKGENILLDGSYWGYSAARLAEAKQFGKVDVLFIGSSHCYRGFDTRLFEASGKTCFNLGTSNQSHIQTQVLLKRYIDQLQPDLVVYEVYPEIFEIDGVESALDLLHHDADLNHSLAMVWQQASPKVLNTFCYKWWEKLLESPIIEITYGNDMDKYISGGYAEKKVTTIPLGKCAEIKEWTFKKEQQKAFEANVAFLKDKNIPVLLCQTPVSQWQYSCYSNNTALDKYFTDQADYINFNNENIALVDSLHFYDSHHLNQNGVEIFNQFLIEKMF